MKRTLFTALLLLCAAGAQAQYGNGFDNSQQRRPEHSFYYEFGTLIYVETVNLTADNDSLSRILVNFRIAYDAITFEKPLFTSAQDNNFTASIIGRVDLLDQNDVTIQRGSWGDTVRVPSYLETNDKFRYVVGSLIFDVKPGTYTVAWTIEDGATHEPIREARPKVIAKDFHTSPIVFSKPLLAASLDANGIVPWALGGNAEFGTPMTVYTELTAHTQPSVTYELVHYKLNESGNKDSAMLAQSAAAVKSGVHIALNNNRCCTLGAPDAGKYYCTFSVSGDSLEAGDYELRLHATAGSDTANISHPFKVVWSDMPLSLSDLDYSIDAMRYILTDAQLDSMKSGNRAERKKHFDDYWKAQDPTPGTVYNERQTEYYRRVDYSFFNFRNPIKPDDDGMRTDRGKVFILYGKPTSVDRRLLPDGPAEEIWTYRNNVDKQFIFHDDEKNGNYRLAQVVDLTKP
ncbi:MAG TPA: GWxTD domain-containing protein [Candidatus Kapabacteria bacterium]|nr:GWxTD domain-containing protein [Candidatus Kapabacteria bacterium]